MKILAFACVAIALSLVWAAVAVKDGISELDPAFKAHVDFLNEVTSRRRLNTLFVNEQSARHGLRIGMVNTYTGNLTFLRRDLVAVTRLPLVAARVYDSAGHGGGDFGPGWRLSLAETIEEAPDGRLTLIDDSGSSFRFKSTPGGHRLETPEPTDFERLVKGDQRIELSLTNGWLKVYEQQAGTYYLVMVRDEYGNELTIDVQLGRVEGAASGDRWLKFTRDESNRIVAVEDDQARSAQYVYDDDGRLSEALDLGGNRWSYQYQADRLVGIVDPNGNVPLVVVYGDDGRVRALNAQGLKTLLEFDRDATRVIQGAGETVVRHNAAGIAYQVINPMGTVSTLELNDRNQPTRLDRNGALVAYLRYERDGRMASIERHRGDRRAGWPEARRETPDFADEALATVDESGNLTTMTLPDGRAFALEYNHHSQITAVTDAHGERTKLGYDPTGRLAAIEFANGKGYFYDRNALGDRILTRDRGDGKAEFTHDPGGNLLTSRVTGYGQPERGLTMELDAYDRLRSVTFTGHETLTFEYGKLGNPTRVHGAGTDTEYEYDALHRLTEVRAGNGDYFAYHYADGEPDIRLQMDERTAPNSSPTIRASATFGPLMDLVYDRLEGRYFEGIRFDASSQTFVIADAQPGPLQRLAHVLRKTRLWDVGNGAYRARVYFDTPSNVVFIPAEHRSKNCCVTAPPDDPEGSDTSTKNHHRGPTCGPDGGDPCAGITRNQFGFAYVGSLPSSKPYEQGTTFYCSNNSLKARQTVVSATDKCALDTLNFYSTDVGWGHSHPFFRISSETFQCGTLPNGEPRLVTLDTAAKVNAENTSGEAFSANDIALSSENRPG